MPALSRWPRVWGIVLVVTLLTLALAIATRYRTELASVLRLSAPAPTPAPTSAPLPTSTPTPAPLPALAASRSAFTAAFYNNTRLAGPPVHVRVDAAPLDHQWLDAAPALGVLADGFSARFEGEFDFETARYRFDLRVDDGVRLYIDDEKVLDAWQGQVADFAPEVDLTAGQHRVRVEYYEGAGNAQLTLNWRRTDDGRAFTRAATLFTHLYALDGEKANLEDFAAGGGAVENVGDRLLVATTHGYLALIHPNGQVEYLDARIPMNLAGLEAHAVGRTPPVMTRFRVTDILLQAQAANRYALFAAHHYFADDCIRLRLSAATLVQTDGRLALEADWRTVFDAEPCLTFQTPNNDVSWKGH